MRRTGRTLIIIFFFSGLIAIFVAPFFGVHISALQFSVGSLRALSSFASYLPKVPTPFGRVYVNSRTDGSETYVEVFCDDCEVTNERLSTEPLIVDTASVKGTFKDGRFNGIAKAGAAAVELKTTWSNYAGQGTFVVPLTKISDLYQAMSSIVPEAKRASIQGTVEGKGTFTWPDMRISFRPRIKNFSVNGLIRPRTYSRGRFDYIFRDDNGTVYRVTSGEGTTYWASANEMGRFLPAAVLATEDASFYSHPGYDLSGILEAVRDNERKGKIYRGGSTLTQQLAKNLFSGADRTYARKLRELLYAVEMERELGKRRILELYLNIIEWGPGIFGAKNAAARYFGKTPAQLLPEEAAWLASSVRSPRKAWEQEYLKGKARTGGFTRILYRMKNLSDAERGAAAGREIRFTKPPA